MKSRFDRLRNPVRAVVCFGVWNAATAFATPWCHFALRASDGTEIRVDYQVDVTQHGRDGFYYYMRNTYVHAENPRFKGREEFHISFDWRPSLETLPPAYTGSQGVPFQTRSYSQPTPRYTMHLQLPAYPLIGPASGAHLNPWTFRVWIGVDKTFLNDAASGERFFQLTAADYPASCPNKS